MAERLEEALLERLREDPAAPCIWWKGSWWSREDLSRLVRSCESTLARSGFGEGMRLAAPLPNSPLLTALSIACWRLGGAIAPLNLKAGIQGMQRTLGMLDVHAAVVPAEKPELASALAPLNLPWTAASAEGPLGDFTGRGGAPDGADTAVVFSTSGTTGLPKAVPISHGNLLDNTSAVTRHIPYLNPGGVLLNALPNFHTLGFSVAGVLPLLCSMGQAILPTFIPAEAALEAIRQAGVTGIVAVPTMISLLLGAVARGGARPESLSFIISGGDRLNPQLDRRARDLLGAGLLEGYGLTECSPVVSVNPDYERRKLGTVGTVLDSYQVQVRGPEGQVLPPGQDGVLWVKGPSVTSGYFRDPANSEGRFVDGWFDTGDVVRLDDEGFVTVLERATDILIVGGFNVYPQEVERVLQEHPAVHTAAVAGEPNPLTGEIVKAFVILQEGASVTPKELVDFCKERLAHFKVPRKVRFVTELPLSSTGKVQRRALRDLEA